MSELAIAISLLMTLNDHDKSPSDASASDCSTPYLKWMCEQILNSEFPAGKANRWIGYIQGVMVATELSTVDAERARIRYLLELDSNKMTETK